MAIDNILRSALKSGKGAAKKVVPKGVKLKPAPLTEGNLAKSKFVKEQLNKRTTYKGQELSAPVSSAHYAHEFWHMPGKLTKQTQVDAALAAKGFFFTALSF